MNKYSSKTGQYKPNKLQNLSGFFRKVPDFLFPVILFMVHRLFTIVYLMSSTTQKASILHQDLIRSLNRYFTSEICFTEHLKPP
jgi:hypothetical protein